MRNWQITPMAPKQHGHATRTNGLSPTYQSWKAMLRRCYNPNFYRYDLYGGRGITVCKRWRYSFENFLADMGSRPEGKSIDRYPNPDGHYERGNCRWATAREQAQNIKTNLIIEYQGERLCLQEWSRRTGISHGTIRGRYLRGLPLETIFCSERLYSKPNVSRRQRNASGQFLPNQL